MNANLRSLAESDIESAVAYYRSQADTSTASDFVDAFEAAINHLSMHPFTGSPRFSFELEIPELRVWPLHRFPYLIFYVPDEDEIDIWRVLHARRDIPAHLTQTIDE